MKTLIQTSKVILLALIVVTAVSYAQAEWNNPPGSPTTPNAPTPINVSNSIQTKEGSLYATILGADRFCLGSDCIDKWSDVINRGGDNSVDTTNLQNRVTGTCGAGSSIRAIDSNGKVTCEKDDVGQNNYTKGQWCGWFYSDEGSPSSGNIPCVVNGKSYNASYNDIAQGRNICPTGFSLKRISKTKSNGSDPGDVLVGSCIKK